MRGIAEFLYWEWRRELQYESMALPEFRKPVKSLKDRLKEALALHGWDKVYPPGEGVKPPHSVDHLKGMTLEEVEAFQKGTK